MAAHDHAHSETRKLLDGFEQRLAVISQERAGTEAVLYSRDASDEWKREARLEYELHDESGLLEYAIRRADRAEAEDRPARRAAGCP